MVLMTCCGNRYSTVADTINHTCKSATGMIQFPAWVEGPTLCKTFTNTVVLPANNHSRHAEHLTIVMTNLNPNVFFAMKEIYRPGNLPAERK